MNSNFLVYQIFPKILSTSMIKISDNEELILHNLIKETSYYKVDDNVDLPLIYASHNKFILNDDKLIFLKNYITKEFNRFKNNVLQYHNTSFEMTTSWLTKTPKNHFSDYHYHSNCMFSGIFYFDNSSNLEIRDFESKQFLVLPQTYNDFNAITYTIKPKKNMIVFFDSRLHHKVQKNNFDETRYSLAFNFIPKGQLGAGDSQVFLK